MGLRRVPAGLITSKFPFNYDELSSCVVLMTGVESAKQAGGNFVGNEAEQQAGIPQAYYMENVIPISRGFASVHYTQVIPEIPDIQGSVHSQFELRGQGYGLAIMAVTETHQYIYDALIQEWLDVTITNNSLAEIFVANVKDEAYIFFYGVGLYRYDFITHELVVVTPTALDIGSMRGITSAGVVLVFWDLNNRIYTSSVFDPLDFTPSLATGAGSIQVNAITSSITTAENLGEDFIIYTKTNAVAARQTGDIQFPFVYKEIEGSTGLYKRDHVASHTNAGEHVIWNGSGFQSINVQQANYIWPELRDGISRGLAIKLDPLTEQPIVEYVEKRDIKLQFCTNNFISISLKTPEETLFKEAYIYDRTLRRWGRLVVDHSIIFDNPIVPIINGYTYADLESDYPTYGDLDAPGLSYFDIDSQITPDEGPAGVNIGVISVDGKVHIAASSETANFRGDNVGIVASDPRIFLGRYKLLRDEGIDLRGVMINKLHNGRIVAHGHLYNGSYVRKDEVFYELPNYPGYWNIRCCADSVTVELNGRFTLTDLQLEINSTGAAYPYGVPPAKKFYNYITSVPYPLWQIDDVAMSLSGGVGEFKQGLWEEYLNMSANYFFGELRPSTIFYNQYVEDLLEMSTAYVSGTNIQTLFEHDETIRPDDFINMSTAYISGTNVQTYFPITHTLYPNDFLNMSAAYVGGTLA